MAEIVPKDGAVIEAGIRPIKLMDQLRDRIRYLHYSNRTEQAYAMWIRRYICFHDKRHPLDLGALEIESFLTALVEQRNVSASTHTQALSALLFLYKEVLKVKLPWLEDIGRPKKPQRLPAVLSQEEVIRVLARLEGVHALMARLRSCSIRPPGRRTRLWPTCRSFRCRLVRRGPRSRCPVYTVA